MHNTKEICLLTIPDFASYSDDKTKQFLIPSFEKIFKVLESNTSIAIPFYTKSIFSILKLFNHLHLFFFKTLEFTVKH